MTADAALGTCWLQTPADTPGQEQLFVLIAHPTGGFVSFGCAWGITLLSLLSFDGAWDVTNSLSSTFHVQ